MKSRYLLFYPAITVNVAIAAFMAAAVSCAKEEIILPESTGLDVITLFIDQPTDEDATKTVIGTPFESTYPINWSAGDKIALSQQSGSSFEEYTLSSGAGSISGFFTGNAVSGPVFAYYPYDKVFSVNTNTYNVIIPAQQTFAENSFGETALPMYGISEGSSTLHSLKPLMSVLKLPLKGSCKVTRIVVSSASQNLSGIGTVSFTTTDATLSVSGNDYVELLCPDVQLNETTATLFHIAVPASAAGAYTVRVITDESKVLTKTLTVTSSFSAGKMKKTAVLSGVNPTDVKYVDGSYCGDGIIVDGMIWAPVNCGYEPATSNPSYKGYTYGKLYQWGRRYGQGYNNGSVTDADYPGKSGSFSVLSNALWGGLNGTEAPLTFYKKGNTSTFLNDWIIAGDHTFWNVGTDSAPVRNSSFDPCPSGWRVPTSDELSALVANKSGWTTKNGQSGYWYSGSTPYSASASSVFLPACGFRHCSNLTSNYRNTYGYYWSSSVNAPSASDYYHSKYLAIANGRSAILTSGDRGNGYSVRCVKE